MVFGLLLVLGFIAACGGETEPTAHEVVLYTSMPEPVVERLKGVIEQRFPDLDGDPWVPISRGGITLRVVRGRTADLEQRIADEIAGGGIQADLIWLAEPSPYEEYKEMGLLAPYHLPEGAPIHRDYVDPDGFFVAGRIISMVVAWDPSQSPALADWPDLHDATQAAFPAPQSGAARATIKALIDEYGPDFFTRFADGGGVPVASNGAARDGVVAGTFDAVAVLDYMAREAKAAGSSIDFAYPESGTLLIPSPIAITSTARYPTAAKDVADFILSESGQKIIVKIGNFYPVRADVDPPPGAPALDMITPLYLNWAALPAEIDLITTFWDEIFAPADSPP